MVVAPRDQLRRNLAATARESFFENRGHSAVEKAVALSLPESVQGSEPWRVEGSTCTDKPRAIRWTGSFFHAPLLLEEPAQFVDVIQPKGHCELLSRSGLERRHVFLQMRGC